MKSLIAFKFPFIFRLKLLFFNFGPQHPAAHGVLRLLLILKKEKILKADPHIGFLHRGTEKLCEKKTFLQSLPYFNRLDYVSMLAQEHVYCLALEKLSSTCIPIRAQQIRVIFSEITRILNHLLGLTTHAIDVGAMTPILWAFECREQLFQLYEMCTGARMHAAFFRPGGLAIDVPFNFFSKLHQVIQTLPSRISELENILTHNRIWCQRLKKVGIISFQNSIDLGFRG